MKGYATTNSPYARKIRVAIIETNQNDLIDWNMITREERAILVPKINPLGKVPVVVLDNGEALFDSPVICAWVDSQHNGHKLIPVNPSERWKALCLEALGDGLGEAAIAEAMESSRPEHQRSQAIADRQHGKVMSALKALENASSEFVNPLSIGEISVACAIGYMDFRNVADGWRQEFPNLGRWYDEIQKRPSFSQTAINPDM